MSEWTFRLTLAGIALTDEEIDALFEAGCDDATFSLERDGTVLGFFDREADSQEDAVLSAIHNVEGAAIGVRVIRVTQDDDWLTASEIAERVGRTRQSIGLLIRGDRDPADSLRPWLVTVRGTRCGAGLKSKHGSSATNPWPFNNRGFKLSPDFLAELNDRLDLRERLLHTPDAPWRPRLAEALPLGA